MLFSFTAHYRLPGCELLASRQREANLEEPFGSTVPDFRPRTGIVAATIPASARPLEYAAGTCPDSRENGRVNSAHVEVTNGKVLYDGESLVVWASRVAERIVERCGASRVVLYGSVARGEDGPDSDIDLLVVLPIVGRRHDTAVRVLSKLRDLPVPVEITVVDPAHLHKEASTPGVVRRALREGVDLVTS